MWQLVHVITKLELGGAQFATLYQLSHSRFADETARTLIHGPGGMLDEQVHADQAFQTRVIPSLRREVSLFQDLRALKQIRDILRSLRNEYPGRKLLVHTHSSKAGILGRWAAFLVKAECVVHTAHGFGHSHHGNTLMRWFFRAAEWLTGWVTDGFTADSAANVHQGRIEGLFKRAPARVVRCGIDVESFAETQRDSDQRAQWVRSDDPSHRVVVGIACLKPQKDPITFIRVAAQVLRRRPNTTFLLAGDGVLRADVEEEMKRLGTADGVRLLGWWRDIPALLACSDLLLLTSLWEGLPQVFGQSMAAAKPIVATRVDGAPEAVEHGDNGLLYDPGDVEGMTRGVLALLDDDKLAHRMGQAGRLRAGEFSSMRMMDDLDDLYGDLTGEASMKKGDLA